MRLDLDVIGIIGLATLIFNAGVSWQTLRQLVAWRRHANRRIARIERILNIPAGEELV